MAVRTPVHHPAKTLGESAICFACIAGLLIAVAVGLQWMLHLLP